MSVFHNLKLFPQVWLLAIEYQDWIIFSPNYLSTMVNHFPTSIFQLYI